MLCKNPKPTILGEDILGWDYESIFYAIIWDFLNIFFVMIWFLRG